MLINDSSLGGLKGVKGRRDKRAELHGKPLTKRALMTGLRTLDLFLDKLQPDYMHDHIEPVRAKLVQVSRNHTINS